MVIVVLMEGVLNRPIILFIDSLSIKINGRPFDVVFSIIFNNKVPLIDLRELRI